MAPLNDTSDPVLLEPEEILLIERLFLGMTRSAIARHENITERQIYRRLDDLKRRLGVENDAQLVVLADRLGLISCKGLPEDCCNVDRLAVLGRQPTGMHQLAHRMPH